MERELCSRLNNGLPKDIYILTTQTCECVTLHGQKDFVDLIKVRIWKWRDYPGNLSGLNVIIRVLMKGRQECQSRRRTHNSGSRGQSGVATRQGMGQPPEVRKGKEQTFC